MKPTGTMKKLIGVLFLFITITLPAQYVRPSEQGSTVSPDHTAPVPQKSIWDNLSLGGSFGLQFGSITFVEVEPLLNYHFGESFMIGVGPIYQYVNAQAQVYGFEYTASTYGARVSALFFLPDELSKIFIMGEYDVLNVPELNSYNSIDRGNLTIPLAGIGYRDKLSDKFSFFIYGLWNFNNSIYNPYTNPTINAGFDVGLWH